MLRGWALRRLRAAAVLAIGLLSGAEALASLRGDLRLRDSFDDFVVLTKESPARRRRTPGDEVFPSLRRRRSSAGASATSASSAARARKSSSGETSATTKKSKAKDDDEEAPKHKSKPKHAKEALNEDEGSGEHKPAKKHPKSKAGDEDEDAEAEAPSKQHRASAQSTKKKKGTHKAHEDEGEDDEVKSTSHAKKKKPKDEDDEEEHLASASSKKAKHKKDEEDAEADDEEKEDDDEEHSSSHSTHHSKKKKKAAADEDEEDEVLKDEEDEELKDEGDEEVSSHSGKKKKKDEKESDEDDEDAEAPASSSSKKQKSKAKEIEIDSGNDEEKQVKWDAGEKEGPTEEDEEDEANMQDEESELSEQEEATQGDAEMSDMEPERSQRDAEREKAEKEAAQKAALENISWDNVPPRPSCETPRTRKLKKLCHTFRPSKPPVGKPLHWLHVSKSAGSFFCDCAKTTGLNAHLSAYKGENCHYLAEDQPMWGYKEVAKVFEITREDPHAPSCEALMKKYEEQEIQLEGNENYLANEGKLCPQFHNILIMRSPIHRLISHLTWLMGADRLKTQSLSDIVDKFPVITNNFYVRSIGGNKIFRRGFGQVTGRDLAQARQTLHAFDEVFIVGPDLLHDVETRLGWTCLNASKKSCTTCSGGKSNSYPGGTQGLLNHFRYQWSNKDFERLLKYNELDNKLFEEAQNIDAARRFSLQAKK